MRSFLLGSLGSAYIHLVLSLQDWIITYAQLSLGVSWVSVYSN
jgi:hypothetical protein